MHCRHKTSAENLRSSCISQLLPLHNNGWNLTVLMIQNNFILYFILWENFQSHLKFCFRSNLCFATFTVNKKTVPFPSL